MILRVNLIHSLRFWQSMSSIHVVISAYTIICLTGVCLTGREFVIIRDL